MQNAKDSFYEVLRDRLANLNPDRTIVVRGITRPAVVVDENETENIAALADCFHLRWTEETAALEGLLPLVAMTCEVSYATAGTGWNGGMDRGRVLASMDGELLKVVSSYPQNTPKKDFAALAQGGSTTVVNSRIWWSDVIFGPAKVEADRIARAASVQVMCFEEAEEQ